MYVLCTAFAKPLLLDDNAKMGTVRVSKNANTTISAYCTTLHYTQKTNQYSQGSRVKRPSQNDIIYYLVCSQVNAPRRELFKAFRTIKIC